MEILRIAGEPLQLPGRKRPDQRTRGSYPVLLQRMRREERAHRAGRILPLVEQDPEHLGNAVGIDAGLDGGADALLVGFGLVALAEVREQAARADVDRRGREFRSANAREDAAERHAQVRALRLLHLLDRVTPRHVPDLVTDHAGDLAHRLRPLDQPAIHVHVAARHRERVDLLAVHDVEVPLEVALVRDGRERIAQHVDVPQRLGIVDERELPRDLRRVVRAHLHFLLLRHGARREHGKRRERGGGDRAAEKRAAEKRATRAARLSREPVYLAERIRRQRAHRGRINVLLLTLARDLKRRKARERRSQFVAEGVRTVEELLRSPVVVRGVLRTAAFAASPRGTALLDALARRGIECAEVGEDEFLSAADTEHPQGILAVADVPESLLPSIPNAESTRLLVLDAIQDPGNVGSLVRTGAALGVAAVVALPGTADLWNAKAVRGGAGAHFRLPAVHALADERSEEHTSELQSRQYLVCRLLLEKKNK